MNRVSQQGHDLVIFESNELDSAVNRAVANAELVSGNTVSAHGISIHLENGKPILVVKGQDFRPTKPLKDVLDLIAKYKTADRVLAALSLTLNSAAAQPEQTLEVADPGNNEAADELTQSPPAE